MSPKRAWLPIFFIADFGSLYCRKQSRKVKKKSCQLLFLGNHLKDVRANCLCASLLRTQFMSQRHATSCTSARAKEEIYSHEGMVSVALTSLRFNSLEWSVTPAFFRIDDFLY